VAWGAIALALAGCPRGEKAPEAVATVRPSPGIELEGAQLTETREGEKIWDLKARHVAYRTEGGVAELTGVTTRFFEDGKLVSTGKAPRATFYSGDRRLRLEAGIAVEAEGGQAGFSAGMVTVMPDSGQLEATGHVTFRRGANTLSAERLSADRALKRVTLGDGVHGRFTTAPDGTSVLPVPSAGI
jgi:LPS export ABC transporter protein LptC